MRLPFPFPVVVGLALLVSAVLSSSLAEEAKVFFIAPKDGQTVESPVQAEFGLDGMKLAPAGATEPGTGHHHVLVDLDPIAEGEVIPADPQHIHFGKAQSKAELPLAPGPHKLTLQLADGVHKSYGPALSQTISVTVKEPAKKPKTKTPKSY